MLGDKCCAEKLSREWELRKEFWKNKMVREGFRYPFEQILEGLRMSHSGMYRKGIPGRRNSRCKGPEAEAFWVFAEHQESSGRRGKKVTGLNGL